MNEVSCNISDAKVLVTGRFVTSHSDISQLFSKLIVNGTTTAHTLTITDVVLQLGSVSILSTLDLYLFLIEGSNVLVIARA
jgi:hypothetical protein